MSQFVDHAGTLLIALDGLTFFSSKKLSCAECLQRQDNYFHSAVTPVLVKPDLAHVLPLMPEFVVPQDGADKQDCEQNAAKRWLAKNPAAPKTVTYLGDALYATQPFCELVAEMHKLDCLHKHVYKHWNGKHYELWTFRFASDLPLRGDVHSMQVNWLEVTVTHATSGKQLYFNSWVTNHGVSSDTVFSLAKAGRARWKIENENNNVLKNHGYHLEHNFGHGAEHLSNVLFTLNLLAFLVHTVQELTAKPYQILRAVLKSRKRFFNNLRALLDFHLFESWQHLWLFMLNGLAFDQALLFSD